MGADILRHSGFPFQLSVTSGVFIRLFFHPRFPALGRHKSSIPFQGGFTLVELLMVVLLIGILTTTGIRFYSGAATDTRLRTANDSIEAMLQACQNRARWRGQLVRLEWAGDTIQIVGAPSVSFPLPQLTETSRVRLEQLQFCATATLMGGDSISSITVSIILPGSEPATVCFPLQQ